MPARSSSAREASWMRRLASKVAWRRRRAKRGGRPSAGSAFPAQPDEGPRRAARVLEAGPRAGAAEQAVPRGDQLVVGEEDVALASPERHLGAYQMIHVPRRPGPGELAQPAPGLARRAAEE